MCNGSALHSIWASLILAEVIMNVSGILYTRFHSHVGCSIDLILLHFITALHNTFIQYLLHRFQYWKKHIRYIIEKGSNCFSACPRSHCDLESQKHQVSWFQDQRQGKEKCNWLIFMLHIQCTTVSSFYTLTHLLFTITMGTVLPAYR